MLGSPLHSVQNRRISVIRNNDALLKTDSEYSLDEVSGVEMGLSKADYHNLKEFSDKVGIASRHLLMMLKSLQNLCISIRPVNPETKKSYYGNHGSGKRMDIKLKSANYGPIAGFIPLDHRLGKVAQIDMKHYEDEIRRHIEVDKLELEGILSSGSPEMSTDDKNYIGSVNFQITDDQGNKKDLLYATSASGEIVKDDDGNPIYFWEKENHSEGAKSKKEFFFFKNSNGNESFETDADLYQKVTVAGNEIKPVKVLSYRDIVNKGPSPEIVDNIIIPDYDLFTYGLYTFDFYQEPDDKLKTTLEEVNFKKQPDVGEVFTDELEIIRKLSALTGRPMIVHASEVTNKNPEPITEDGIYTFFLKKPTHEHHHVLSDGESSPASLPDESSALEKQRRFFESPKTTNFQVLDMDIGKIIAVQGCENLVKTIEALRKDGYEIKIGPRWGFVFDRQTEEITYDQEKRDLWKVLSKDETLQLVGFKGDVQYIASNLKSFLTEDEIAQLQIDHPINDYKTKKTFLDILKTKFSKDPNGSNKSFVKDLFDFEYFSETTFDFKLGETQETPQNLLRKININIGLLHLDIIYQFEKIIQLQVSPKFKATDDEEAKSKRYEELLSDSIDSRKKAIDADIASLKEFIGDQIKFDDIKKELELSPFSRSSSFASPIVKSHDESSPSPKPEKPDGGVFSSVGAKGKEIN